MSPDFVRTPMCEFQTEYALSLSPGSANKKLLPLMYRTCDIPAGLKHIAGLYYTRDELKVRYNFRKLLIHIKKIIPGANMLRSFCFE